MTNEAHLVYYKIVFLYFSNINIQQDKKGGSLPYIERWGGTYTCQSCCKWGTQYSCWNWQFFFLILKITLVTFFNNWVSRGIYRGSQKVFLADFENRIANYLLLPIIKGSIRPGTTIIYGERKSLNQLSRVYPPHKNNLISFIRKRVGILAYTNSWEQLVVH